MKFSLSMAALLLTPAFLLADEASKNAKIEEMLHITHADQMMTQIIDQMKNVALSQLPNDSTPQVHQMAEEMQTRMMALLKDRMTWDKAKPAFIAIYNETFTEPEIDGILTFYRSPAGQAMLQKMPQLIQKSMVVGQQLVGDVGPEVDKIVSDIKAKYKVDSK